MPAGEHGQTAAIACMDGSWWVDWPRLAAMRDQWRHDDPQDTATFAVIDLLFQARGNGLREVSWERQDEIAREYGAKRITVPASAPA